MKKTILLLVMVLSFTITNAQIITGISSYQNLDSNFYDAIHEIEVTFNNNLNLAFSARELNKRYTLGLGYSLRDQRVSLTPTVIVGSNIGMKNKLFYGLDTDLDINILKWFALSAKCRYVKNEAGDFTPTYFAGIKIKI